MISLLYGKPFTLIVAKQIDEIGNNCFIEFRTFLTANGYKYRTESKTQHTYFHIICDDFIDAAKIETFLQTP